LTPSRGRHFPADGEEARGKIPHEEEKKQIEAMGWDKLMETLRQRLKEQQGRHQGATKDPHRGTSPFARTA